ncbi:hypothetical protein, partial [Noviherbaspirillum denitrificans]|uniref:hypothetical protein n=1 Tax=Noviherbaspirillum denitrificans TaxID=1968433 RepID=UPI00197F456C
MTKQAPLQLQALVDLLARREPDVLEQMRRRYPEQARLLHPGKMLGTGAPAQERLLADLFTSTAGIVKQEGTAAWQLVSKRIRSSARLRLGGSIVSSLSSAGLV